eukprot:CAMPEP_0170883236 /NCGR_PEP_ID=MMETSP0734-20130129/34216_1 /TAXON_ID=186038 /ORGANISM="Fragilariopsis kerguelensis, Strain L26-C5" /LENGTH=445 /DNA_ID=CAMNT_0011267523 /DNA_START=26 /DNA_END=1363 /DNA_ORIENTATION=+
MHAITANEPTTTTTTTKSCTTRTEYNQRLISLLNQNEELKTKLQQVQRSGQRYQLKSTVQAILIKELMETIEQFTITRKNNTNHHSTEKKNTDTDLLVVLTTNYTQRMAELSMDRETMEKEIQVQPTDVDKTNNNRTQSSSISLSSSSSSSTSVVKEEEEEEEEEESTRTPPLLTTTNTVVVDTNSVDFDIDTNEAVSMIDVLRQQRDSYQTKCETLTKSVTRTTQTLKKKHTEREIRCSLSLRTMRQQLDTMEQERKRWILSQEKQQTVAEKRIQSLEIENQYLLTQQQQQQQQQKNTTTGRGIMDDQREEEEESKHKYNCHRIQNCVMGMRNTATASRDDRDRDRDRQRMVFVVPSASSSSLRCRKPNSNNNNNNNNNNASIPSLPLLVSVNNSSGEDTDTDTDTDHEHDSDIDTYSESIASSSSSSSSSSNSSVSLDLLFEV